MKKGGAVLCSLPAMATETLTAIVQEKKRFQRLLRDLGAWVP